jgi:hypothetical protein
VRCAMPTQRQSPPRGGSGRPRRSELSRGKGSEPDPSPGRRDPSPPAAAKPLQALAAAWRREAEEIRERYGMEHLARLCEVHARELTTAARHEAEAVLTLEAAASYSGYSTSHLRALQAEGKLSNPGRRGSPRFYRGELPRKPPRAQESVPSPRSSPQKQFDADAVARSVLSTG